MTCMRRAVSVSYTHLDVYKRQEEWRAEIRAELNQLTICLLNAKRYNDLEHAAKDIEYQKKLLKEFGIELNGTK